MRGVGGPTSERRIQLDARAARNVGQLQAIDRALRKVVAARHDQRFGVERARRADVPGDGHALGADEGDLRRADVGRHQLGRGHDARSRSADARARAPSASGPAADCCDGSVCPWAEASVVLSLSAPYGGCRKQPPLPATIVIPSRIEAMRDFMCPP